LLLHRCDSAKFSSQRATPEAFVPARVQKWAYLSWHRTCWRGLCMSLLSILLVIILVGVLLWAINSFVPMDSKVKSILNIVVVLVLIFWLLKAFGLIDGLANIRV
jgi:hypothetical protein